MLGALTYRREVLGPGAARVVFKQEADATNSSTDIVPIDGVAAIHAKLDMVLLTVAKLGRPRSRWTPLPPPHAAQVAAIGFPGEDPVNNPLFLSGVFGGDFGVKRAALGEVLDGSDAPSLFHDCSTTQGNSGSPIFTLATGKVAASTAPDTSCIATKPSMRDRCRISSTPPKAETPWLSGHSSSRSRTIPP